MDKKNCLGLNKEYKVDVNVGDYENLYVGLEFEFNPTTQERTIRTVGSIGNEGEVTTREPIRSITMREIIDHFGVREGKTDGKGKKTEKLQLVNGGQIEVPVLIDLYNDNQIVTEVYQDGCTQFEVVTRPVNLKLLKDVKREVFDYLKNELKADFICGGRGGLHMTFLLDHHKERSKWNKTVVQNLMQYSRCYYEELIQLGRCNEFTRNIEYRKLIDIAGMNICSNSHHNCITCRKDGGDIWAIEVRFPDGTDDWDKILRIIKFWMAMIRHCAVISKYGRISFDQILWDKQRKFYDMYYNVNKIPTKKMIRTPQLIRQIKDSLIYYGLEIKNGLIVNKVISKEDILESEIWELVLGGTGYNDICKIMKKKGYDQRKIYAACKEVGVK